MCGLIGYAGRDNFSLDKIKLLFILNEHRGKDSCGLYIKDKGIVKVEGEATKNLLPYVDIKVSNLLIGHVRQGTVSTKTKENSHPFREEQLIQAHNGKIDNYLALAKEYNFLPADYKVDSHVMLKVFKHHLDKGDQNYILTGLQKVEGPISMLLCDINSPDEIMFFTNGERPLFIGEISEGNYYFSSVDDALLIIGIPKEKIIAVPVNKVHTLNVKTNTITDIPFVKVIVPKVIAPPINKSITYPVKQVNETWECLKKIYRRETGEPAKVININFSKIELKSVVEFTKGDKTIVGKVIGTALPFNNIYLIQSDTLDFVDGSLLTEVQDETYTIDDFAHDDTVVVLREGKKCIGTISYVERSTKTIYCDFPRKGDDYDYAEFQPEDIIELIKKKTIIKDHYITDDDVICSACNDTEMIGNFPCPHCSVKPLFEEIPSDNDINYEDFDNAYELYTELESQPSFFDENDQLKGWSEEDVMLAEKLKKLEEELFKLPSFSDGKRRDLLMQKKTYRDRRGTLLNMTIAMAKSLEEQINVD